MAAALRPAGAAGAGQALRQLPLARTATTRRPRRFDLTAAKSYDNLLAYGDNDLQKLAFERDRSIVGECPARKSKLLALLTAGEGHEGVRLDARQPPPRLATWMDTYAQRQGSFSPQQEEELRQLRQKMAEILDE